MPLKKPAGREAKGKSPRRDRDRTRHKILDALGVLLARDGFRNTGINAIAREAGVDKVLVYRYFGGLDGLFAAFAKEFRFFPSAEDARLTSAQADPLEMAKHFLLGVGRTLRRSPTALEIMRWELSESNALTDLLAAQRERRAVDTIGLFQSSEEIDLPAIVSILAAGQTYLALRAKFCPAYNKVNLRTDGGWARLEGAIARIVECLDARYHLRVGVVPAQGPPAPESRGSSRVAKKPRSSRN